MRVLRLWITVSTLAAVALGVTSCADKKCDVNAECSDVTGKAICKCNPGYAGLGGPGKCVGV